MAIRCGTMQDILENLVRRRALHGYFCRRTERQQLDQQRFARAETRARLSPAARYVLGIDEV